MELKLQRVALALLAGGMAPALAETDFAYRFRGIRMLYGERALDRFSRGHVAIVGLGGVGSWAAESIARTGFGTITLCDLDDVCISNTNRQVHALADAVGVPKVEALEKRIALINPECKVNTVMDWVTAENAAAFLQGRGAGGSDDAEGSAAWRPPIDAVIEAVGLVSDKCALINAAAIAGIPVIATGSASARRDLTRIRTADLAEACTSEKTLEEVLETLRAEYGWPSQPPLPNGHYGVQAVTSTESPQKSDSDDPAESFRGDSQGSASMVTAGMGFAAAGLVAELIASGADGNEQPSRRVSALRDALVSAQAGAGRAAAGRAAADATV
jgi:tRNA A37 threonylcarbamoyladenosine dehydratase